jgi:hypothetical protein
MCLLLAASAWGMQALTCAACTLHSTYLAILLSLLTAAAVAYPMFVCCCSKRMGHAGSHVRGMHIAFCPSTNDYEVTWAVGCNIRRAGAMSTVSNVHSDMAALQHELCLLWRWAATYAEQEP